MTCGFEKYEDMLYMPSPVSKKHPPMPMINRAAQFSPFAALSGFDDAINKTSEDANAKD